MITANPDRLWYVIRTNIKCEERASKALRAAGFRVYMPQMKKTIIHHRTKAQIDRRFKLFNRYLFVSFDPSRLNYGTARSCDGVETILGIDLDGKPCEIPRAKVRDIMMAQRKGEFDDISPKSKKDAAKKRFTEGSRLQVRSGHTFAGFYGNVVKVKGKGVIRATLEIFGKTIPVEIEPQYVEPVDQAA